MNVNANVEQLKADVAARIKWARANRLRYKRQASFVAVYIGLISALATVCIGIVSFVPDKYSDFWGVLALVSSASLTVVAAWDGIFQHKRLWLNTATMLNELYELETDIRHAEAGDRGLDQAQANEFYECYKRIIRTTNEQWYRLRE